MKQKTLLTLATGALCAGSALAQTSTTLYGIMDVSVRYMTNADRTNGSLMQMTNGAITSSRWGVRGTEDLGGGLSAVYQLEGGIEPDTGSIGNGGRIFGRKSFVGLAGSFGTVRLGRQSTEGFNLFGDYDPLTVGNYNQNAWPFYITQFRSDNMVSYAGSFGGLNVGASYAFSERTSAASTGNSYWGGRAAYTTGKLGVGAIYQELRNGAGNKAKMWGAAAKYGTDQLRFFLGYMGGEDATGLLDQNFFSVANSGNPIPAGSNYAVNPRKDTIGYVGLTYKPMPKLALSGVVYGDHIKNTNGLAGVSGKRYTGVLLAEYALSRRTQLYTTLDYNKVSGGAQTQLPGKNNQTGLALGIRHVF